jgi:hypothetical protein
MVFAARGLFWKFCTNLSNHGHLPGNRADTGYVAACIPGLKALAKKGELIGRAPVSSAKRSRRVVWLLGIEMLQIKNLQRGVFGPFKIFFQTWRVI